MNPLSIRRPISSTIAWSIIAEIIRHSGSDFHVIETHPGGGQYDLLSLFRASSPEGSAYDQHAEHVGDFNLRSGKLHGQLIESEPFDWLSSWFENFDPKATVAEALKVLGVGPLTSLGPTDRHIFGHRLIAALLAAKLFDRNALDARMGFADTSGYGGGVSGQLRQFTSLFHQAGGDEQGSDMKRAARCWLLLSGASYDLKGAIRTDGQLSSTAQPDTAHDLFASYKRTHSMRKTVAEAREILSL